MVLIEHTEKLTETTVDRVNYLSRTIYGCERCNRSMNDPKHIV